MYNINNIMSNKFKIAIVAICLNEPYWPFISEMIASARKFLLKGHDIDFLLWTDMPQDTKVDATIFPTEPFQWPMPTLHRYHLFLRQEEKLREYDYIYYIDADMKFVARVGDEILGNLVAAPHPGYFIRKEYIPPYEPNDKSEAFIPRPGRVVDENGKKRFMPFYAAGGFQGGRSDKFIEAMKAMKDMIDKDFSQNSYIPIWNDESVWNAYLFKNPPTVYLTPSYIYPDSLIQNYYIPLWGRNYVPRLITLTKKFSLSKEGGEGLRQILS
jgi:hypothetical protein